MIVQRIKGKTDNCYLVTNGSSAMLVDTASGEVYDQVLAECSKYDMKLIVLTHVHFDHAENAAKLAEHFDIPVAFHPADEELFVSYDKQPLRSYGLVGKAVLGMSLKVLRETEVKKPAKFFYVREGDTLNEYGFDAKIIELPGHTAGSIGVDVEGRDLIVGDALDNWIMPATGHLYSDKDALKKSAAKIRALGRRKIYYGHGKPTLNS
ncbi:MAG: MBL fold metallo-hydrolase [Clostridiales bacterium]|nr:MBL fold metallo-hydrolase [Clostridiales bacterium]